MFDQLQPAKEISGTAPQILSDDVLDGGHPLVLRGAFKDWPVVQAALQSDEAAVAYLNHFYNGRPVSTIIASASEKGRFFYREDSKQLNFQGSPGVLSSVLEGLLRQRSASEPLGIAIQALLAAEFLPGFEQVNPNRLVPDRTPARLWIGNKVTVAPHFDVAHNLACVAAGRRRFVLFPPEQTANIYPGPMDITPANVPISMVSLDDPDFNRFPRYREALDAAFVADLEPGDAIYIPYLWWHGVQSLGGFNVLVNYWWNREDVSARYPYAAFLQLAYALYRDMPASHRGAWRALYDHYVFHADGDPMEALFPAHRDAGRRIAPGRISQFMQVLRDMLS